MRKVFGVLAVSLLTLSLPVTAAAAPPADDAARPVVAAERPVRAVLLLRIVPLDGAVEGHASAAEPTDRPTRVLLTCGPDGGTHPSPNEACESLRAVGGQFDLLPVARDQFCPMIYDPVRVEAIGRWDGRWVRYSEEFGNRCEAAFGTDGVFDF